MPGFLKMWKVSGLTSDGARISEPIYDLGYCLSNKGYFENLDPTRKTEIIAVGKQVLVMKDSFDAYYENGASSQHDAAVKFLVMISALLHGHDNEGWDWQKIRHVAQGLYGSMTNSQREFTNDNIPIINKMMKEIKVLIEGAVK